MMLTQIASQQRHVQRSAAQRGAAPRSRAAARMPFKHACAHKASTRSTAAAAMSDVTQAQAMQANPQTRDPGAPADALGVTLHSPQQGGGASFRVWVPHGPAVFLRIADHAAAAGSRQTSAAPSASGVAADGQAAPGAAAVAPVAYRDVPLQRSHGDTWAVRLPQGELQQGTKYCVVIHTDDGRILERRDPYARQTDFDSKWCFVDDPAAYPWKADWQLQNFDEYVIYELHVGSFTPDGTFEAATKKLQHIADLGFTAIEVMPIAEFSSAMENWGYNPRQLMSVHGDYGTPEQLRTFIDTAHAAGLAVIVDVVLHHGAVDGNELWEYDGWGPDWNGGIYHEGQPDTEWGRGFAFWKQEVRQMVLDACSMWLGDYRADGLRFDSANDLPHDVVQYLTWNLHESFPGKILTAEVTPENPMAVRDLGFDSLWVHSGYFDIIQQHRALGRGHHGGGDWAAGWDLPRLRTVMALHFGFEKPYQCIKYLLGSHDQCGCRFGGAHYEDYKMIGGQHRYAVDHYGGGRGDPLAFQAARLWYAANVGAAGIPMLFMGTEFAQSGWWNADEWHSLQWGLSEDDIGKQMMALVRDANLLRKKYPELRSGWPNILHEDRQNGVMAFERVDGVERMVIVVNAGQHEWLERNYGVWVGGGEFEEVFNSQAEAYGGWEGSGNGTDRIASYDGRMYINLPVRCTMAFKAVA